MRVMFFLALSLAASVYAGDGELESDSAIENSVWATPAETGHSDPSPDLGSIAPSETLLRSEENTGHTESEEMASEWLTTPLPMTNSVEVSNEKASSDYLSESAYGDIIREGGTLDPDNDFLTKIQTSGKVPDGDEIQSLRRENVFLGKQGPEDKESVYSTYNSLSEDFWAGRVAEPSEENNAAAARANALLQQNPLNLPSTDR